MMAQSALPFQYEIDQSESGLTSFAGLPLYLELAIASGLTKEIANRLNAKQQGWSDQQIILSLILLNIAGGDCVDDIERLESDAGMRLLLLKLETHNMSRKQRRAYERRWRKKKQRAFPSASAIHSYLNRFHNAEEEWQRKEGSAFIPSANELLQQLQHVNEELIDFAQRNNPCTTATLDQDATLCPTYKKTALYSYKGVAAYQPFNTYWHEQEILLHSEFRDGNVNAGFDQLRLLQQSLDVLPDGVANVFLRSDSAGYQQDLLRYCAEGKNERFGVIEFAIAAKISKAFKLAVLEVSEANWQPIYKKENDGSIKTNQEWAEVPFVPSFAATSKSSPNYRYIAIRERMSIQPELEGLEPVQKELPFQTLTIKQAEYKLFGIVTNRTIDGNELINWHRERCGHSEKIHSIEKSDLAGGQFPSSKFGANAAWWHIMILAMNLNALMKKFVMPVDLKKKRMKGLRLHVISIAGRMVRHARTLTIKLCGGDQLYSLFEMMRERIRVLAQPPPILSTIE